jgi:hypothetical protein
VEWLGTNPTCTLSADHVTFIITLGDQPSITIGQRLTFKDETIFFGAMPHLDGLTNYIFYAGSGDALLVKLQTDPGATQTLGLGVVGPSAVEECGQLKFVVSSARGAEGRPLSYGWSVGDSTASAFRYPLYQRLSAESGPVVSISSTEWSQIVADAKSVENLAGQNLSIEVVATVRNWRDLSEAISKIVVITLDAVPKPIIEYVTQPHLSIGRLEEARFAVKTSGVLRSACGSSDSDSDGASDWSVVTQWSITADGYTTFTSVPNLLSEAVVAFHQDRNLTDSGSGVEDIYEGRNVQVKSLVESIDAQPVQLVVGMRGVVQAILDNGDASIQMETLDGLVTVARDDFIKLEVLQAFFNMADTAHAPNVVAVPAFEGDRLRWRNITSSGFTNLVILATAAYATTDGSALTLLEGSETSLPFTLQMSDLPSPRAVISGPERVGEGCSFSVSAAVDTLNPYDTSEDEPEVIWHVEFNQALIYTSNDAQINQVSSGNYECSLSSTLFDASAPGQYKFTVSGKRRLNEITGWTIGTFSETRWVEVVKTRIPPPITLHASYDRDDRLSVQTPAGFFVKGLQPQGSCTYSADGWSYYWVIAQDTAAGSIITSFDATIQSSTDLNTWETTNYPGALFRGGLYYKYALVYTDATDASSRVANSFDLESMRNQGFYVLEAPRFLADAIPSLGTVQVTPVLGWALTTSFSLAAVQWIDDTPASELEYEFFKFPIPTSHPLYSSMQCDLTSATCVTNLTTWQEDGDEAAFPINWDDSSSDFYWSNLGSLLRGYSAADTFEDVILSQGKYIVAVRVRDGVGGVGSAKALGCIVQQPAVISTQELVNIFDKVHMSGDADAQLNTIMTVSETVSSNQSQEIMDKTLQALDAAATNFEPGNKVLAKIGTAMESISNKELSKDQLNSVAASLETSLDKPIDEGLKKEGAEPVIRAISVMHVQMKTKEPTNDNAGTTNASNATNSSSEDEARAAFAEKMFTFSNNLGKGVVNNIPEGGVISMVTSENGSAGVDVYVAKESAAAMNGDGPCFKNLTGVRVTNCPHAYNLSIGHAVDVRARRLKEGRRLASCDQTAGLHQTVWVVSNPHYLEDNSDYFVPPFASARTMQILACDISVDISLEYPIEVDLVVPPGNKHSIKCVRHVNGGWTTDGLSLVEPYSLEAGSDVMCRVYKLQQAVTYAIAFDWHEEVTDSIFRLCPSIYLPSFQNISWKCARDNYRDRSSYAPPLKYIHNGSICLPLCQDGLVINPLNALADCTGKGWKMHHVSEMYCAGWWEDEDPSGYAREWRLPITALLVSVLGFAPYA